MRFMRYASRVRTLVVTPAIDEHLKGHLIFDEIAQTRTTLNVFPKLTWLTWTSSHGDRLRLSLMFMHENVKRFAVLLTPSPNYSLSIYFQEIALRMPKVTRLDFRFTFSVRDIEAGLCQLFGALPKLEDVTMPKYALTTKIIEVLSRLENLGAVQFEFLLHQGCGDVADVQTWRPVLQEGAFPALYDFNVNVKLPDMLRFMSAPFFPSSIRLLYIHLIELVSPKIARDFFVAVAERCPQLTQVILDYIDDPIPFVFRRAIPEDEIITWDTIRPLLRCPKITSFTINWATPLTLSQADIEEIASSWPRIEALSLNPGPMLTAEPSALTLHALIPFAKHCPNLRELGLYINTSSTPATPLPDAAQLAEQLGLTTTPFPQLVRFFSGISPIDDHESVALFLSQLFPLGCEIVVGVCWTDGTNAITAATPEDLEALKPLSSAFGTWFREWEEVKRVLPLLTRLRIEEKKHKSQLEHEVDDLRMRCKVLEERLGIGAGAHADSGCVLL